jgi:hypothetical protein
MAEVVSLENILEKHLPEEDLAAARKILFGKDLRY